RPPCPRSPSSALVRSAGGGFHGLQLWVNLPRSKKWVDPRYQDLAADHVALGTTPAADTLLRVIAGEVGGLRGPGATHTPMAMVQDRKSTRLNSSHVKI